MTRIYLEGREIHFTDWTIKPFLLQSWGEQKIGRVFLSISVMKSLD